VKEMSFTFKSGVKKVEAVIGSGRITRGPEGAWPPERPGGPLETPHLRGYKGASKSPPP